MVGPVSISLKRGSKLNSITPSPILLDFNNNLSKLFSFPYIKTHRLVELVAMVLQRDFYGCWSWRSASEEIYLTQAKSVYDPNLKKDSEDLSPTREDRVYVMLTLSYKCQVNFLRNNLPA